MVPARIATAVLALLLAIGVLAAHQNQIPDVLVRLQPGETVEHALDGAGSLFTLRLSPLECANLVINTPATDLVVQVFDARDAGVRPIETDVWQGRYLLPVVGVEAGTIEIRIRPKYPLRKDGTYSIRVDDLRAATASDRLVYEALRQLSESADERRAGAYAAALASAERPLQTLERGLGQDHPRTAIALAAVGAAYAARNEYDRADAAYRRALAIHEKTSDVDEAAEAAVLDGLANDAAAQARFADAERFAQRALGIRERRFGSDHPLVAESLRTLGEVYVAKRDFRAAEGFAERAIGLAARAFGPGDEGYVPFMTHLGRVEMYLGNYARAEDLLVRSADTTERVAGGASLASGVAKMHLATLYLLTANNVKSEQLYREALAIEEPLVGENHLDVGLILHGLALLSYRRSDYDTAATQGLRALAIRERLLGQNHPVVGQTVNNLGLVYWRRHELPRAASFFRRAVEIYERLSGADSVDVGPPLMNLGIIQKESGDYDAAEVSYKRALAIHEATLGPEHPTVRVVVESLGILYRDKGDYARAEPMFRRAIEITEHSLGPDHSDLARHFVNLAQMYEAQGDAADALGCWLRVSAIDEKSLPLNLAIGSERQKLAYFETFTARRDRIVSFHVREAAGDPQARDLAAVTILQSKGRVLDALADTLGALRKRANPDDLRVFDRLNAVTAHLASVALHGPQGVSLAEHQQRMRDLAKQREDLEADVGRRTAGYYERVEPVRLADIRAAIPPDAALIEFAVYRPFDPGKRLESDTRFGDPRYIAYVIRNAHETRWAELGSAHAIDAAVAAFRGALRDPARPDVRRAARALDAKIMQPLRALAGDATHLLISPDGQLSLVPFEALVDERDRYLIGRYAVSYLTSGRDLLRMKVARPSSSDPVIVADPDFGEPSAQASASDYFAPLPGTLEEARAIHALFPRAAMLTGQRASESALKAVVAPAILHVATHGFFLHDPSITNPLLRSGIALSGANAGHANVLTALEASNLNLWGTRLVTLSACDTGMGEVRNGEGVYGLRRALLVAGVQTIVMSLWPVGDYATRTIMTRYYAGLKRGLGRGEALRRAKLSVLARSARQHPYYWASFIQEGDWTPLDRPVTPNR